MTRRLFPLVLFFALAAASLLALRAGMGSPDHATADDRAALAARVSSAAPQFKQGVPATQIGPRRAVLRLDSSGHFRASARVDGASVDMLVDSGASVVALTGRDARKIGIDTRTLTHFAEVVTAGGRVKAGRTRLGAVRIGGVEVSDVEAVVIETGLEQSLLGMSFLSKLESWQVTGETMTIRQ